MKRILFYFAFIGSIVIGTGLFYSSCTETQKKIKYLLKKLNFQKRVKLLLKKGYQILF